ncbi:CHAP domain-containing protein [Streptosporangium sp. CA-135522]|uniref:CHAP domain-containing protein n=1 Tax=Streptosporangium sp. CA-135522 TaxID=3240072 RepID=UPI003D934C37
MQKFIELLESELGYSEKSGGYTKFGHWYGNDVEVDADYTAAPWCDMYLSWAAHKLGYEDWVGQFAYTVYHAEWFKEQDAWGTTPEPGAIVFFDWSGSKKIDKIDHVGIVTKVTGRTIHTIEGNIDGGVAKRKERDTGKVVGYGYPEKVKARLDREATQKQTVITSADIQANNSVALDPAPNLLAMVPPPGLSRETDTATSPVSAGVRAKHTKPGPKHAKSPATDRQQAKATPESTPKVVETPAQSQISAGRTTTPGKHAKPATADTNAIAATPAALSSGLSPQVPQLGTPAVLAPVLLAAVAILAHAKTKQSRVRLAFAEGEAAPARPSRRTPGRRRAPGRRRITKGAPVLAEESRIIRETVPETTLPQAATADFPSVTTPLAHVGEPVPAGLVEEVTLTGQVGEATLTSRVEETVLTGPVEESTLASLVGEAGLVTLTNAEQASLARAEEAIRTSLARAGETGRDDFFRPGRIGTTGPARGGESGPANRRHDGPRAPYQGRRRLRERPVVESSTFVQDAPLRGRRHRRSEPVVSTTIPTGPLATAPADALVPDGYRGRRRARVPV